MIFYCISVKKSIGNQKSFILLPFYDLFDIKLPKNIIFKYLD